MASSSDKIKVLVTIDFDAVSGYLGTGTHPNNLLNDYSAGIFSARVGVPRLLALFRRLGISDRVTWFLPGHSIETFPGRAKDIVDSGAEIAVHGNCHEGASQLSPEQQRDVLDKSIEVTKQLTGKSPVGYRAPLLQIDEHTLSLLQERGFLYDASLSAHDCRLYRLPANPIPKIQAPRYHTEGVKASEWMQPLDPATLKPDPAKKSLIEVPNNWYGEDMTPMQFFINVPNSHGYVPATSVEAMWRDRLELLLQDDRLAGPSAEKTGTSPGQTIEDAWDEEERQSPRIYALTIHPDTSGMAHIVCMVERFLVWVKELEQQGKAEFCTMAQVVEEFRARGG